MKIGVRKMFVALLAVGLEVYETVEKMKQGGIVLNINMKDYVVWE